MLGIIGGTGLSQLSGFTFSEKLSVSTPYSEAPVELSLMTQGSKQFLFLPRHGKGHSLPPHKVDYRANIWALRESGVKQLVGVNAVGGIHPKLGPGSICVPDQIIDYTWGRDSTYFDEPTNGVTHIDFTFPFTESLRHQIQRSISQAGDTLNDKRSVLGSGVYGCTQGPRLESAAEIVRLKQDGCDLVGMTAMPEVALARELELEYGMLALSVNWGAGLSLEPITLQEIHKVLDDGMAFVTEVLKDIALAR